MDSLYTTKFVSHLTAKQVNAKPQLFCLTKHHHQAVIEVSNHEVAGEIPKQKPWPNAETNVPPRLSAQIMKKQQLHGPKSKDNEERKWQTAKNSKNKMVKE